MKLGTYIDVNESKCRSQEQYSYLTFYLSYLSLIIFIKGGVLSCLGVQVVFDYKFCLYETTDIWETFLPSSGFLMSL